MVWLILRDTDSSLLLITQPDHAALAGRLLEAWHADGFAALPRRSEVLRAATEHDNGWSEVDRAPLVGADGRLLDFVTAPEATRRAVWPRGVDRLESEPYAAALVAQHAIHVLDRHRRSDGWTSFFDEMTVRRDRCLDRAARAERELLDDYFFVRTADLMSLIVCNAWRDERAFGRYAFALGRPPGAPAGAAPSAHEPIHLFVSPDPFSGNAITFEVEARCLPRRRFASAEDAAAAFDSAPRLAVRGAVTAA